MSDMISTAVQIDYKKKRCWRCGSFWAIELLNASDHACTCPVCAAKQIQEAEHKARVAERAVAALRGALKKAKAAKR